MNSYLLVALGGAVGSALRYLCSQLAGSWSAVSSLGLAHLPVGTLLVNLLGSFLIGVFAGVTPPPSEGLRLLLVTGVLGGFTTFSALSIENLQLLQNGQLLSGTLNMLLQPALGVAAAAAGMLVATVALR